VHNLRKICDEIFGESNFISCFIWNQRTTGGHDSKNVNIIHEYIIAYAKSSAETEDVLNLIDSGTQYSQLDKDSGRNFKWDSLWTVSHGYTENCDYDIQAPDKSYIRPYMCHSDGEIMKGVARWFWSYETFIERKSELSMKKVKGIWKVYKRVYGGSGTPIKSIFDKSIVGGTSEGKILLAKTLSAKNIFDNPKHSKLLIQLLERIDNNEIVLDFFSGSATTAHAVMQLNADDKGKRKYICVQIPEKTDEKSEAFKANYKNICEIGKERIRRAGEKIKKDNTDKEGIDNLDVGFRVLTIDSSNMKDVYFSPSNTNHEDILYLASNIKEDRTDEDLLFMVLLAWGIDLSSKIERKQIAGKTVYFVDNNYLAACFDKNINEDFVKKLVEHDNSNNLGVRKLLKVVLKDSSFTDSVKINAEQIFKQANIEIKVI
jgi:adenine-specific DNA-methyltransferase